VVLAGSFSNNVQIIDYEFPFTERVRMFLRLENLFAKLNYFVDQSDPLPHHSAIMVLFEILESGSRADLKSDLLQELERQRQTLSALQGNPAINADRLQQTIDEITGTAQALGAVNGRLGQHLRENEWLMMIRGRSGIPGGVCEFDLPSYHAWQHENPEKRRQQLLEWIRPMLPLARAIHILLDILRHTGPRRTEQANNGSFTQPLAGKQYQLARLSIPTELACVPEVSANKYMVWIRFNQLNDYLDAKTRPCESSFQFTLQLCNF
jgi:cell division protein ZapD